jgi:hypothetical protein
LIGKDDEKFRLLSIRRMFHYPWRNLAGVCTQCRKAPLGDGT